MVSVMRNNVVITSWKNCVISLTHMLDYSKWDGYVLKEDSLFLFLSFEV